MLHFNLRQQQKQISVSQLTVLCFFSTPTVFLFSHCLPRSFPSWDVQSPHAIFFLAYCILYTVAAIFYWLKTRTVSPIFLFCSGFVIFFWTILVPSCFRIYRYNFRVTEHNKLTQCNDPNDALKNIQLYFEYIGAVHTQFQRNSNNPALVIKSSNICLLLRPSIRNILNNGLW